MARQSDLPLSVGWRTGPQPQLNAANYYLEAMPRLADLVASSESANPALSIEAAETLSALNERQREMPEYYSQATGVRPPPPPTFDALKDDYATRFRTLAIRPQYAGSVAWHIAMLNRFRPRYEAVGTPLGVPWHFIGCIHALESSFNFRGHLHNGDPLSARTRQVPRNRPDPWLPPSDWESSARDALTMMGFAGLQDWSLARTLYRFERYNGFGYRRRGIASPYLWSFSTHYDRGKYRADGVYDPQLRSQQCGVAVLIKALIRAEAIDEPGPPEP